MTPAGVSPVTLAVIGLRSASLALSLAGQGRAAAALNTVADGIAAGTAVDAHLQLVADKLKAGPVTDADWDDVMSRIKADSARLQAPR